MLNNGIFGPRSIRWAQSNDKELTLPKLVLIFVMSGTAGSLLADQFLGHRAAIGVAVCYLIVASPILWSMIKLRRQARLTKRVNEAFKVDLLDDPKGALPSMRTQVISKAKEAHETHKAWLEYKYVSEQSAESCAVAYYRLANLLQQVAGDPVQHWRDVALASQAEEADMAVE